MSPVLPQPFPRTALKIFSTNLIRKQSQAGKKEIPSYPFDFILLRYGLGLVFIYHVEGNIKIIRKTFGIIA